MDLPRTACRGLRLLTALCLVALGGCAAPLEDPEAAFGELSAQRYPFLTTWEVLLEAAQRCGFEIASSERDGEQGSFVTEVKVVFKDALSAAERGERLHVRVTGGGDGGHRVHLAASVFRREAGASWVYQEQAGALRARFEDELRQAYTRRYQTRGADGAGGDE